MSSLLDPSRIIEGIHLRRSHAHLRRAYRRCRIASLKSHRMQLVEVPAIWDALQPERARILCNRAAWRFQAISNAWYEIYTREAYAVQGFTRDETTGRLTPIASHA